MGIATELDKRTNALKEVLGECNDALFAQAAGRAADLSSVPEQIRGLQNLRVLKGIFTPAANTSTLTLPIPGYPKVVSICQKEVERAENAITCLSYDPFNWKRIAGDYHGIALYTYGGRTMISATEPSFDGSQMTVPELLMDLFYWLGGKEHIWEAYYWDDLSETLKSTPMGEAVYSDDIPYYGSDLSTAVASYACGETAKAYVIPIPSGGYRLAIVGSGETADYTYLDAHPWDAYADQIYELFVEQGITAIGSAFFCKLSKARSFVNRSPALNEIGNFAFYRCFGLQSAKGLSMVETVGEHAFQNCASLQEIDLSPRHCTEVMSFANHMSSVEDSVKMAQWSGTSFGICANRRLKWGEALEEIQSTKYTADKLLTCLNPDMQTNYPDIQFGNMSLSGMLFPIPVSSGGCAGLALYHAYNTVHAKDGKACENFREFWYEVLKAETPYSVQRFVDEGKIDPALIYQNGADASGGYVQGVSIINGEICFTLKNFPGGTDSHEILGEMLRRLGWSVSEKIPTYGAEAKQRIDSSLQQGIPVLASVNHMGLNEDYPYNEGDHEVCIIGCNRETNKLTVVDSTGAAGTVGHIYEVAYEDLFYSYEEAPGQLRNSVQLLTIGG